MLLKSWIFFTAMDAEESNNFNSSTDTHSSDWWSTLSDFIWNEKFWLPVNHTWVSLDWPPEHDYPIASHLLGSPFRWSLSLLIIRYIAETLIFEPVGKWLGVANKYYVPAEKNAILTAHFFSGRQNAKYPSHRQLEHLATETGWTIARVKVWFFLTRQHHQPGDIPKFCMACWKVLWHTGLFCYGLIYLLPKTWLWNLSSSNVTGNYPLNQPIEPEVMFYFSLQFAYYGHLLWGLYFDYPRDSPEFWRMLAHHVVTLSLDYLTLTLRLHRFSAAAHFLLDPCDILLELARLTHYVKTSHRAQHISNMVFLGFAFVWIITRNILFPWLIVYPYVFHIPPPFTGFFPALLITHTLTAVIVYLQFYWSFKIWSIGARAWRARRNVEEATSDVEDELFEVDGGGAYEEDIKERRELRDERRRSSHSAAKTIGNGSAKTLVSDKTKKLTDGKNE